MTVFKGTVLDVEPVTRALAALAEVFPEGARVRHTSGREGTVHRDEPANCPGLFDGRPTAWCLSNVARGEAKICVAWDNPHSIRWILWVPTTTVTLVKRASRENKPALAVAAAGR